MERAYGFARLLTAPGTPVSTVTVGVYAAGYGGDPTHLATLYRDNLTPPTPLANPFLSDAYGFWFFYAANGRYDIVFSGGTPPLLSYTLGDVLLYEAP